jgi:ATP-binding cassette, subfamily C (CFTR/MRP), member 1
LGANGHIAQRGTYDELRQQDGFIKSILLHPTPSSDEGSQDAKAMKSDIKVSTKEAAARDQARDLARRTGDMAVYAYYMKSVGWRKAMVFAGFAALAVFASSFSRMS